MDIDLIEPIRETETEAQKQKKEERTISCEEKMLHSQSVRQTKDRWQWLQNGTLKRETGTLIFAAQERAIWTNVIKGKIDKSQELTKCRMCSRVDETVKHIVSESSKLAQKEYKRRHDWIGRRIHWKICVENGIHVKSKWHEHQPEALLSKNLVKFFGICCTDRACYNCKKACNDFHW